MTETPGQEWTAKELLTAIHAALTAHEMPAVAELVRRLAVVDPHAAEVIVDALELTLLTDMTPGFVVEAATPGSGGAGVRESGEGSKTPVPPLAEAWDKSAETWPALPADPTGQLRTLYALVAAFGLQLGVAMYDAGLEIKGYSPLPLSALTGVQG